MAERRRKRRRASPWPGRLARVRALVTPRRVTALVLAGSLAGGTAWAVERLRNPDTLPLRAVQFEGEFRHQPAAGLERAVGDLVDSGFFSVDVDGVRRAVESMPWVASASVRRLWPDGLRVRVTEHEPVARWGADGVLSAEGVLFHPAPDTVPGDLPRLSGPAGRHAEVLRRYRSIARALAPFDLRVARLVQDERRSWTAACANGMQLLLGHADPYPRLMRFLRVYGRLGEGEARRPLRVDLRYSNGFAVRWADGAQAADTRQEG